MERQLSPHTLPSRLNWQVRARSFCTTPTRSKASLNGGAIARQTHRNLLVGGIPELPETLARLGEAGAKLVVIDTPPALTDAIRSVMQHADFVLVPTQDGITDLKAIGRTVQLIRELDRPYAFALTFVKPGTSQATDAATALSKFGPLAGVVCHRMLFKTAFNDSRTAQEIDPKGKAAAEVGRVWDYLGKATGLIRVLTKGKAACLSQTR